MSKRQVFISHSRRDANLAEQVVAELERLGLQVSSDAEVRQGEKRRKVVQDAIKRSDALVMLIASPHEVSSSWMGYEAGVAEALGKRTMLLVPSKYPLAELPEDVAVGQVVDFDPQAPERAAQDIAKRLAAA